MEGRPRIEMLWEAVDPDLELTARFGFRDGPAAAAWTADVLGRHWGLDVTRCDRLVISGRNAMAWIEAGGRPLVAKWSSAPPRFSRLRAAADVVAWLDTGTVPVAAPIPATDGRLLVELGNDTRGRLRSQLPLTGNRFLVGVLPVVTGALLDVDDPGQVAEAGRMLATLHRTLAAYPGPVPGRRRGAAAQLVHNDFRSANLIHDGSRIAAVLDFEELAHAPRVADLAKASVLLATRFRDWGPTSPEVRGAFVRAYAGEVGDPSTAAEHRDLGARTDALLASFGWA